MKVQQFVMAYEVEQDRLRAILPEGFISLRPVLRINAEIRQSEEETVYVEFNTAVEAGGKRGWLNIDNWNSKDVDLTYTRIGKTVEFTISFLKISYKGVGIEGGCPAEKDNDWFFTLSEEKIVSPTEKINSNREFCDCEFSWKFTSEDAYGVSTGKTIPAFLTEPKKEYEKQELTTQNAAKIPCKQVLGSYVVEFERTCE